MTPGSYVSEICRAVQLRSQRKDRRVVPLLAQRGTDVPLHLEAAEELPGVSGDDIPIGRSQRKHGTTRELPRRGNCQLLILPRTLLPAKVLKTAARDLAHGKSGKTGVWVIP